MLAYFTFFEEPLSPRLWSLWPAVASCLVEFGIDSWPAALVPFDNFISRDTPTFLSGPYPQSVFDMVRHSLVGGDFHEEDIVSAPRLLCVVLQNCRGQVDQWIEPYLRLVVERLPRTQRRSLKDELLVVVANTLYYNPQLALQALGSNAVALFGEWFGMIFARRKKGSASQHFRTLAQKRAVALGLVSLLAVPDAALPAEIAAGLPQVLTGILRVLADFKEEEAARAKDLEEDDDDYEEGGRGGDSEEDDEEDDEEEGFSVVEADDVTQRKLRAAARSFLGRGGGGGGDGDDDDDDDDDSDEWEEDDEDAESPLDAVDPFAFLAEGLHALSQAAPARAQQLAAAGGPQLAEAVAVAEARRREAAEAEAKKAAKQQK
jgi:hypothetical protein